MVKGLQKTKNSLKRFLVPGMLFEDVGITYLGPVDGHDLKALYRILKEAQRMEEAVLIHVITKKGKGYAPAEENPSKFHGVSPFDKETGEVLNKTTKDSYTDVFSQIMCDLGEREPKLVAMTAAMKDGTGLAKFQEKYPDRFFDVGIAEEHAVSMAGGLAKQGMVPVVALYSTFLQRSFDMLIHDVSLLQLHVVFAVDRAGLVGADGETHQGTFDVPYLRTIPGMKILAPSNFAELQTAPRQAVLQEHGPVAVRYPRGAEGDFKADTFKQPAVLVREGVQVTLCTYGCMLTEALAAADKLAEEGISAAVVKINDLTDDRFAAVMDSVATTGRLLVLEDCVEEGCLGQHLAGKLLKTEISAKLKLCNLGKTFVQQGTVQQLYSTCNIDADAVVRFAKELIHG